MTVGDKASRVYYRISMSVEYVKDVSTETMDSVNESTKFVTSREVTTAWKAEIPFIFEKFEKAVLAAKFFTQMVMNKLFSGDVDKVEENGNLLCIDGGKSKKRKR